jgi:hypothetical protein
MIKHQISIAFLFFSFLLVSQPLVEITPPFNIKTVSFIQNNQNVIPIFRLGDSFEMAFDDLFGDEADYYYTITHCDYDWSKSVLNLNEYLVGLDNQRIITYENSFNTLQLYSRYHVNIPNPITKRLKVSGNYMITIYNNYQEVVFSRKFVLYEDLVNVPMQVKNPRDVRDLNQKHNLEFFIRPINMVLQNPIQNIKILLMQNDVWNTAIRNIKPMYTLGNDLYYKYDKETQFWAGNEFLFYENKDIRNAANNVRRISSTGMYNTFLQTNFPRANNPYTFAPDANGIFVVQNIDSRENNDVEADYSWVFFTLSAPTYYGKKDVYITGMFNNYALSPESKMDYNKEKGIYEKAIVIKQGFTNYQYTLADANGNVDFENAIDGNFIQTETNYTCIVYYRANNERFDRVIGRGTANSINIVK